LLPDHLFFPFWEDSLEEGAFTQTEPISKTVREPKEFGIVVHRGKVLRELIKIFKENPDVDFGRDIITATIIIPNGEREQAYDSGGVMRYMLTEFWNDFYESPMSTPRYGGGRLESCRKGHSLRMHSIKGTTHSTCPQFCKFLLV
jgi:hypothetical protein